MPSSINLTDLTNAKTDVDHIADVATSTAITSTDRLGNVKDTIAGAVYKIAGITNRGAWVTATAYVTKDIVSNAGTWYVCVVAHTSSAAFATDTASKWRVYQGVTSGDLAASTGAALVGYSNGGTPTTVDLALDLLFSGVINAANTRYSGGVDLTGASSSDAALSAAIAALGTSPGVIYLGVGTIKLTTAHTLAYDNQWIIGAGSGATKINYAPTASSTCFKWDKGSTVCYGGGIRGITFYSNDTTYEKIAIHAIDTSTWSYEDVKTVYPHWSGGAGGSTFLRFAGREAASVRNMMCYADKPLVIGIIPAPHTPSGISIDQTNFHNMYMVGMGAFPIVTIETGVLLTQVSFTGYQAWVGGTYGLYWLDTTSAAVSNGLSLDNVRFEQTSDATKYFVYISHNTELQGFTMYGGQGGDRNGFYLRKCSNILFNSFEYSSTTLEALNIDATCKDFGSINSFWQAGSTATIAGHDLVFGTPKQPNTGAIAPTAFYCLTSNAARMSAGRTISGTATRNSFTEVLGGGTITSTYRATYIGNQCFLTITIVCAGGATIASVANTSYISGMPTAAYPGTCTALCYSDTTVGGVGSMGNANLSPPSWAAGAANRTFILSSVYEIA